MRKITMISIAAALSVAGPSAAFAGDAGCVWKALPAPVQTLSLKQYVTDVDTLFDGVPEETLAGAILKCVDAPKSEKAAATTFAAAGSALASYAIQMGSEAYLQKELHIEPVELAQAFGSIEPKQRGELAAGWAGDKAISETTYKELFAAIKSIYPAAAQAEFTEGPVFAQFMYYFGARALREQNEAKF